MTAESVSCVRCGSTFLVPNCAPKLDGFNARRLLHWLACHECKAAEKERVS